ncbi:hypothetical protein [Lysobacter capsici]|uniref:hypothetical protein n=1 Tax=Lysobacter capsici TaxID=435897 RepID=UPI000A405EFD|nr:hypothetical protein [Lysobacter capsici]
MKTMLNLPGKSLPKGEKLNFVWNADLITYDGPLVSLFKKEDDDFIFLWVDCDRYHNRWVVTPINRQDLDSYLQEKLTLRHVIDKAELLLVFEATKSAQRRNARYITPDNLPDSYKPTKNSFLYESIATDAARQLTQVRPKKYKIMLDGELYIDDIATVPRLYQQLYSFHYGLFNVGRPAVKEALTRLLSKWKGGINAVNIFTGLRSVTPSIHRARVVHLQYNSPGHIELELLKDLADEIDSACDKIIPSEGFAKAEALYSEIYAYFRSERISGFDSETRLHTTKLTKSQSQQLTEYVDRYFHLMGWSSYASDFASIGLDPLSQLRMLLAYYRRLRSLRKYTVSGKIELT